MRSFSPPIRALFGPGPSDIAPRVLEAMGRPTIGHLDPIFVSLMDSIQELLRRTFRTANEVTFPVSGPGSVGMEACIVNMLQPGDTVVVCQNGVFGGRLKMMAERCGAKVVLVEDEWGRAVSPEKLESTLVRVPEAKVVAFVHAETSTGALSDAQALARIAQEHECLTLVDAVTSLGGSELEVDKWGLDAVYSGSQKCLSCSPGLSPVTISQNAMGAIRERKTPVQSWFMDFTQVTGYWGSNRERAYHHTAPVNALYGLHESLMMILEEGLSSVWERHKLNHFALRAGLEVLEVEFVVPPDERIPQLNTVRIPEKVQGASVRRKLLDRFNIEIGGGLGALAGKVWRIGIMGYSSRHLKIERLLESLGEVLNDCGMKVSPREAVSEAKRILREAK